MTNEDELRLTPRAREMRRLIAEQRASGLTVAAFAVRRGIKATTLFHWRHRFRHDVASGGQPALIPVRIIDEETGPETPRAAESRMSTASAGFVVEVCGGRRVSVPLEFSPADLRRLIEVLESC
jgi:transposase-like protein